MNSRRILTCTFAVCFFSLLVQDAMAFYAPHMGRFVNRDPAGQIQRAGVGQTSDPAATGSFVERDSPGPMAPYHDGMNLYQYVQSSPIVRLDPSGLWTTADCDRWYDQCGNLCRAMPNNTWGDRNRRRICWASCFAEYATCIGGAEETLACVAAAAVTAGCIALSQCDSPAPGPADACAVGIACWYFGTEEGDNPLGPVVEVR